MAMFRRRTVTGIAADRRATVEAAIVVAVVGMAIAIGHRMDMTVGITAALIGWAGLSGAIWYIADRFMNTPTSREDFEPLLRTIGFAMAPGILGVVEFVWVIGPFIGGVGTLWSFAVTAFAVRHTTHFGWLRTIALTIGGGIVVNVLGFVLSVVTGIDPHIW